MPARAQALSCRNAQAYLRAVSRRSAAEHAEAERRAGAAPVAPTWPSTSCSGAWRAHVRAVLAAAATTGRRAQARHTIAAPTAAMRDHGNLERQLHRRSRGPASHGLRSSFAPAVISTRSAPTLARRALNSGQRASRRAVSADRVRTRSRASRTAGDRRRWIRGDARVRTSPRTSSSDGLAVASGARRPRSCAASVRSIAA